VRHSNSRWQHLLDDADVRRWWDNLARGAEATAENYTRALGRLLGPARLTPKQFLAQDAKTREDLLADFLSAQIEAGRAGSYLVVYKKAVASWLEWNGEHLMRSIKIPGVQRRPRLRGAKIPTQDQLKGILNAADARSRLAIALMAFSGFRPEVMGDFRGRDGLRLADFPEVEVQGREVIIPKVPTRILVQDHLSKTSRPYFTFLGHEGCEYLMAHLKERLADGEVLGPEAPIITPRKVEKAFMRSLSIGNLIRGPLRRAGLKEPPYILRSYFSSRCMLAESKGLTREWREFFMGHSGGIGGVYALQKELPPDTIEAMREAYANATEFLETRVSPKTKNPALEVLSMLLQADGLTVEEIGELKLDACTPEELVEVLRKRRETEPATTPLVLAGVGSPLQRIIPLSDLEGAMREGWLFHTNLGDGRAIIQRQA
jgi:integrase